MGGGINDVTLVTEWVRADLSSSVFSDRERERILDDIDDLEEDLVVWGRPVHKCLKQLRDTGSETIYRRRIGDLRAYYIRQGDTLYCIGAGKRKSTYKQDLDRMIDRAEDL